ncbi:glycosyltransferase [Corynebacterium sp. UBA2622]|uniref:glycosyltransferase n=1 Tax=Corynebacterium sp. UBA2622 TaxID=1946393 RepID=UPI0032E3E775
MTGPIGIYAHHHGSGHLHRCREIQRELAEQGRESVIFSTRPGADIVLPDDAGTGHTGRALTAGGSLHYAPYGHRGLRERFAVLARWIADNDPAAFYVDVSVEVCAFVRLMGVPLATLAMPGFRDDAPHQLAYRQADAILAAWPSWVPVPEHLGEHASRLRAVGGISRLLPLEGAERDPQHVVVMAGRGGSTWGDSDWREVERACPGYRFTYLAGENRVDDPTELLSTAGVVVTAAGQNSIADIAVTRSPAIVLPQPRPFAEQQFTARLLERENLAVVAETFPPAGEWPELLRRARDLNADWSRWETAGSARRAAEVLTRLAQSPAQRPTAVLTLADAGRAGHLAHQASLLPAGPDHIVAALADADELARTVPGTHVAAAPERNLAAARNFAARTAVERGNEILIFLDADCVASPEMVALYTEALERHPQAVVAGPVTYMKPGELRTTAPDPHPARPNPPAGETVAADNYNLFWSLSFAVTAETWGRIVDSFGGFDEHFRGYGGEDTDFARNLEKHGIELYWVGGAHAFHQWHPVSSPPWEHLDDILANGAYFASKWGEWPMEGWLRQFEEAGAIELVDGTWRRTGS